eukprot:1728769-Amphidinium_carterae.1
METQIDWGSKAIVARVDARSTCPRNNNHAKATQATTHTSRTPPIPSKYQGSSWTPSCGNSNHFILYSRTKFCCNFDVFLITKSQKFCTRHDIPTMN